MRHSRTKTLWPSSWYELRTSGALDRTHVIIVADHGDHLGEKDFVGHSISLYNELTHVPLIIRDPNGDLPRGALDVLGGDLDRDLDAGPGKL